MFRLGASRWSSRLTTGTQYGPIAAGVRSSICTPVSTSLAQLARCAPAEVASKTILMSPMCGMASSPSTPRAVVGTPMRAARARPSEAGSTPTIAATVRGPSARTILIMRWVPMFPEPMMATGHLHCDVMVLLGEAQRHCAHAADDRGGDIAGTNERGGGEGSGNDELGGQGVVAKAGRGVGQPGAGGRRIPHPRRAHTGIDLGSVQPQRRSRRR